MREKDFGGKIISEMKLAHKPLDRAELLEKYGDQIVAFQWELNREILLKDLLGYVTAGVFSNNLELAEELSKAYKKYKYEKF